MIIFVVITFIVIVITILSNIFVTTTTTIGSVVDLGAQAVALAKQDKQLWVAVRIAVVIIITIIIWEILL